MGSACSCSGAVDYLEGEVEVIYEDTVLTLRRRPACFQELVTAVLQVVPAAKSDQDLVFEYATAGDVGRILNDLSLFEAYVLAGEQRPVIGVKLARLYVPLRREVKEEG